MSKSYPYGTASHYTASLHNHHVLFAPTGFFARTDLVTSDKDYGLLRGSE